MGVLSLIWGLEEPVEFVTHYFWWESSMTPWWDFGWELEAKTLPSPLVWDLAPHWELYSLSVLCFHVLSFSGDLMKIDIFNFFLKTDFSLSLLLVLFTFQMTWGLGLFVIFKAVLVVSSVPFQQYLFNNLLIYYSVVRDIFMYVV